MVYINIQISYSYKRLISNISCYPLKTDATSPFVALMSFLVRCFATHLIIRIPIIIQIPIIQIPIIQIPIIRITIIQITIIRNTIIIRFTNIQTSGLSKPLLLFPNWNCHNSLLAIIQTISFCPRHSDNRVCALKVFGRCLKGLLTSWYKYLFVMSL